MPIMGSWVRTMSGFGSRMKQRWALGTLCLGPAFLVTGLMGGAAFAQPAVPTKPAATPAPTPAPASPPASAPVPAAPPAQSTVVNLIQQLVQEGVLTQDRAAALIHQAQD